MNEPPRRVSPELRASARELRRDLTPQERVLWERLRRGQIDGARFRRQHPFGHFILDFACVPVLLGIEVDGWVHDASAAYDRRRDEFLRSHGWTMLRVRNEEVVFDLDGVVRRIHELVRTLKETHEGRG